MTINIAFSSDNNYAPFLATALYSLLDNSDKKNTFVIYILDGGISESNKKLIKISLNKFKNYELVYLKIDQKIFKNVKQHLQLNQSSYYRLLLPSILPKVKKIIYCDCDLLVLKDISNLYKIKLGSNLIGCCQVFHPNYHQILQRIHPNIKIKIAFNTGVTLMDLSKLRQGKYSPRFINFANKQSPRLLAGDQDILNIVLLNKIKLLPDDWNSSSYLYIAKKYQNIEHNPSIIHFDGIKPWSPGSSHPYKNIYFDYLSKTAFKNYQVKFDFWKYLNNVIFFLGNRIANTMPSPIYNRIEKYYLKNNFLEKKYLEIQKYENNH